MARGDCRGRAGGRCQYHPSALKTRPVWPHDSDPFGLRIWLAGLGLSYHTRLFFMLLWLLVDACGMFCGVSVPSREKSIYKVEKLEGQLQLFNAHMIDALQTDSIDFLATIARQRLPIDGLRVSVVGVDGSLVFDNTLDLCSRRESSRPPRNQRGDAQWPRVYHTAPLAQYRQCLFLFGDTWR